MKIKVQTYYTKFSEQYFVAVTQTACNNNGIELPAEVRSVPDLQRLYKNVLQQGRNHDKLYYFNANHLGSGSLITDDAGQTYQTLAYAPFGESLVNITHSSGTYDEARQFGGHHFDQESGMLYMGARYNEPKLSIEISPDAKWYLFPHLSSYNSMGNNPIRYKDPDGNAFFDALGNPPDNFYQLPTNPANIDTKIWEVYTPERHTGHSMYWRNRNNGTMLAYDQADAHYHLYKDTRFNVRLDAEGTMSGTKLSNGTKLSKGSKRLHLNGGSKINLSSISRSIGMGMSIFSVIADFFKLTTPDAMFSSFNPNGKLNTCYGVNDPNNLSQNLYYEITGKSKDGNSINVNFYEGYYYDHDSKRYRGTGKYMEGVMRKEEKGYRLDPVA